MIPQNDLKAGYLAKKEEIDSAVARVLESGWYILGREVESFEREFAAFIGVAHAVGVANGTDAIQLGLRACGIGPGDAVITVSHTAVATVAAIELAGATPVLVDIDPKTYTIDCNLLSAAIAQNRRVKAIIPVHIYGHPAAMTDVMEIAGRYDLQVIEDCAQSHGSKTGTHGHASAFSFYPTKNLGALGDGGAVLTNDASVAARLREFREYGWRERYISSTAGTNSRLDEIQAAILRAKLPFLDSDNSRRREIAALYGNLLAETNLVLPDGHPRHVFHQFVVRSKERDDLRNHLKQEGVGTLIHYPVPVHLQPAYRARLECRLPVTERIANEIVSLPMYPELTDAAVHAVCGACLDFDKRKQQGMRE